MSIKARRHVVGLLSGNTRKKMRKSEEENLMPVLFLCRVSPLVQFRAQQRTCVVKFSQLRRTIPTRWRRKPPKITAFVQSLYL